MIKIGEILNICTPFPILTKLAQLVKPLEVRHMVKYGLAASMCSWMGD